MPSRKAIASKPWLAALTKILLTSSSSSHPVRREFGEKFPPGHVAGEGDVARRILDQHRTA
jgi:hypothetical protein